MGICKQHKNHDGPVVMEIDITGIEGEIRKLAASNMAKAAI